MAEPTDYRNAAQIAQRLRRELFTWPDVGEVYGPSLGTPGVYFLRFETSDGTSYSIELRKERDDD